MMRKLMILFVISTLSACQPTAKPQNEDMAIGVANLFLKALANAQYAEVYDTYMDATIKQKPQNSLQGFISYYSQLQSDYGPMTKAIFSAFQGVPNESAIQLFYTITHEKKGDVVYHLVLSGDAKKSYKVKVLDIGNHHLYPPDINYYPEFKRMRKVGVVEINLGNSQ